MAWSQPLNTHTPPHLLSPPPLSHKTHLATNICVHFTLLPTKPCDYIAFKSKINYLIQKKKYMEVGVMSTKSKTDICGKNSLQGPRTFKHYRQKQIILMKRSSLLIPPKGGAGLVGKRRDRDPSSPERELVTRSHIVPWWCFRIRCASQSLKDRITSNELVGSE